MFKRNVLSQIVPFIKTHDILLFYWSRQVWKTSLMKIIEEDYITWRSIKFDLEKDGVFDLLNKWPDVFMNYLTSIVGRNKEERMIVFIDEIQYMDNPTSFLKSIYDEYENIKFIVSGSSTLEIRKKFKDSLAWRLLKFDIHPLWFDEFLLFKWKTELSNAIWKKDIPDFITVQLKEYYKEYLTYWWYPKIALTDWDFYKRAYIKQIFESYIEKDIKDIWKIKDIDWFNNLLILLATQIWNLVNYSEISSKLWINLATLKLWLALLENTFIIKMIYPYSWSLRWEIIKSPKIFFVDTGIRNYCANDYEFTWALFENGFYSFIQNSWSAEKVNFYRTKDKQEIDFVIDNIPYELKLSYNWRWTTVLNNFEEKLNVEWKIITLEKKSDKRRGWYYPWELQNLKYREEY